MTNYDFLCDYVNNPNGAKVHAHLLQINNHLYNYSTLICSIHNNTADFNCRKYSTTTSKIQSELKRILESKGFEIVEYEGEPCTYWNFGYMGAENWTVRDLVERGIQ